MRCKGIYCYTDLKTNEIIYIGKDSHIHRNARHKQHMKPSLSNSQHINKILQKHPSRYKYGILFKGISKYVSEELLNTLEKGYIETYSPIFNFTKGGDGVTGYTCSDKTKKRISDSLKGKKTSLERKLKSSKTQGNSTGYFRVYKKKSNSCKKGFTYVYSYYDGTVRRKNIYCVSLDGLKGKVLDKGLEWAKI